MSKKVIFNTIKGSFVSMLSGYNVALYTLADLKAEHKAKVDELNTKLENVVNQRAEAIESGELTPEEAIAKYDILPINKALNAEDERFKTACKPYNEDIKTLQKTLPDELYYAYILGTEKGYGSKGKVKVGKSVYEVGNSYKGIMKDWLEKIGVSGTDNDTALNKFVELMVGNVSGLRKNNKLEKGYVKTKAVNEYKDLVIRYLLQVLIIDKGVVTMNEDYTLKMTEYDA